MFTSTGLFRDIPCPLGSDCSLINCIFEHVLENDDRGLNVDTIYDPLSAGETLSPPPPKRRRIEAGEKPNVDPGTLQIDKKQARELIDEKIPLKIESSPRRDYGKPPEPGRSSKNEERSFGTTPGSAQRPISPPPTRVARTTTAARPVHLDARTTGTLTPHKVATRRREILNPRTVAKPPQTNPKRKAVLTTLHAAIKKLNEQMSAKEGSNKKFTLAEDELILMANDEEEQLALKSADENIYRSLSGQRVVKLRKMDLAEWQSLVLKSFRQAYLPPKELEKPKKAEHTAFSTDLTPNEEVEILRHMRTPLEGLEVHGYVTQPPTEADISTALKGLETSAGFEVCDRCKTRFQVFPGRDEQGRLTSRGPCTYHYARLPFRAPPDATYNCCQRRPGSEGCQVAETHVFKVSDTKRLASIWQYMASPQPRHKLAVKAVAIDCEMGYTTLGLEMIRLSAVSWPSGQEILDVLVRPKGEILDLNTRFSGVSKDQFNKATPYRIDAEDNGYSTSEDGEVEPKPIAKVDSPEIARQLLFDFVGPATPLIGHAIDNDLAVLRIIHPFVVDTVMLYPHPKGLPIRYGLRMLTSKYLDRNIQVEGAGHDSVEDARATGELVRLKVAERWKRMRSEGWTFEKGILSAPEKESDVGPKGI